MKLQLDTTNKVIKLENSAELGELVKQLEKLLPKGEWKEFTLETNTVINNWNTPVVIREYPTYPVIPTYPWYISSGSMHTYGAGGTPLANSISNDERLSLKSGTWNVEA